MKIEIAVQGDLIPIIHKNISLSIIRWSNFSGMHIIDQKTTLK